MKANNKSMGDENIHTITKCLQCLYVSRAAAGASVSNGMRSGTVIIVYVPNISAALRARHKFTVFTCVKWEKIELKRKNPLQIVDMPIQLK